MQNSTIAKIALTAAVLVSGVAFFAKSTAGSTQHYKMVDELLAAGDLAQWHDKQMKVHGFVVAGSIKEKVVSQETVRTFVLQKDGKKIRVFNRGPKPDTFKDQSEVVATGVIVPSASMDALAQSLDVRIDSDMSYVVDATELMAKCPSKYEGAQGNKKLDDNAPKFQ
jgi:cytochrome c-type biogenesis protein CcmE